ncbi:hypothetical protein Droror1_Dr00020035 [Drosera rotundifolia]
MVLMVADMVFVWWMTPREQDLAPTGTHVHQFAVPPISEFRHDCIYVGHVSMRLPEDVQGFGYCEREEKSVQKAIREAGAAPSRMSCQTLNIIIKEHTPVALWFYLKATNADEWMKQKAKYLTELALCDTVAPLLAINSGSCTSSDHVK